MAPLLEFSVRALPHGYAAVEAPDGATLVLVVDGPTTGAWSLQRLDGQWRLLGGAADHPAALVRVSTDDAWRLFYNALPESGRNRIEVQGDPALAAPLFRTRSVIL